MGITYIFIGQTSESFSLKSFEDFIKQFVLDHWPSSSEMKNDNVKSKHVSWVSSTKWAITTDFELLVYMFLPIIRWRWALSEGASKQNMTLTLLHHIKSFLIIIEGNRCCRDHFHIYYRVGVSATKENMFELLHWNTAEGWGQLENYFLQIVVRAFLTHDEASGWRRGVTNSVLVGRALLASGWAFHGLA